MASLSHGLLWGIYISIFCPFFPLSPLFFYASGHSDLVQQMSPDVLWLECVTGVLGIYISVFALRYLMHVTGTMSFLIRFTAGFLSFPQLLTRLFFLSLGARGRRRRSMSLNASITWKEGIKVFFPSKCSFLFSSQYKNDAQGDFVTLFPF